MSKQHRKTSSETRKKRRECNGSSTAPVPLSRRKRNVTKTENKYKTDKKFNKLDSPQVQWQSAHCLKSLPGKCVLALLVNLFLDARLAVAPFRFIIIGPFGRCLRRFGFCYCFFFLRRDAESSLALSSFFLQLINFELSFRINDSNN